MDRYLSGNASHRQASKYLKKKLKQENIFQKKHSTAFAQVSVLIRFEQQDGKVTTDHHMATSNFLF